MLASEGSGGRNRGGLRKLACGEWWACGVCGAGVERTNL